MSVFFDTNVVLEYLLDRRIFVPLLQQVIY